MIWSLQAAFTNPGVNTPGCKDTGPSCLSQKPPAQRAALSEVAELVPIKKLQFLAHDLIGQNIVFLRSLA